jgi:predicted kinase
MSPVRNLPRSPASDALDWLLDGLNGQPGWGGDAAGRLAPALAGRLPPDRLTALVRHQAEAFGPVTVTALDFPGHLPGDSARARVRGRDGAELVITCAVEPAPRRRLTVAWITGLVPESLTPGLPADFTGFPVPPAAPGARLIVFSGVPGTGKSTLSDATGRALGVPVFAIDWLLGALTPFGGYHYLGATLETGLEQLTTLALRQLALGQSVILDAPVEEPATRQRWRSLARQAGAGFRVIVCTCPDPALHRQRVEGRQRGIPGWHDAGDWDNVQRRLAAFPPWDGDVLTVDGTRPLADCVAGILRYLDE